MSQERSSLPSRSDGGGVIEGNRGRIELHLRELAQLYNSLDPSPFHQRDLDREAEQFIMEWAQELGPDVPLQIVIHVDEPPTEADYLDIVRDALHSHFRRLSESSRRQLRQLFRMGRTSLAIGLTCVVASVVGGEVTVRSMGDGAASLVIRESLLIGGWVAMWRPMEIFLYDWWPIRHRRRIHDRLAEAQVRVVMSGVQAK